MKIRVIFLLFTFGGVAVLAKQESSEEKDNSLEKQSSDEYIEEPDVTIKLKNNFIPIAIPSKLGPTKLKPLQSGLSIKSTPPEPSTTPISFSSEGNVKENKLWLYSSLLLFEMYKEADIIFEMMKLVVESTEERNAYLLKTHSNTTKMELMEDLEKEKNTTENQKCLEDYYSNFAFDLERDLQSGLDFLKNTHDEVKKTVESARDEFERTFKKYVEEVYVKTQIPANCNDKKTRCLSSRIPDTVTKIKEFIDEGNTLIQKTKEVVEKNIEDMNDQHFNLLNEFIEKKKVSTMLISSYKLCKWKNEEEKDEVNKEE